MKEYLIYPQNGWEPNPLNAEISEEIYEKLIPFVNSGKWGYQNFTSGLGCFVQPDCGELFISFFPSKDEKGEIDFIKSLHLKLERENSELHTLLIQLAKKHGLQWMCQNGS